MCVLVCSARGVPQPPATATGLAARTPGYLRDLVGYWGELTDWRAAEERLNAYPEFIAEVEGRDIRFVHVKSRAAGNA
ncbi:epoxide hydrolase N-terminal domain-containing protein [Kribbella sp. VKM Ac-2566]|uniref:epoxide hydrolase N-terminal domain-containing protein n=1 Tax=Kribbella sp. VKM Ac-2566 TaxID=2512218 RepID=UPI001062E9D4|nr:epoxide hydrolase N-terminal domain-containing protein [Kribbella sp. VKM Ac-2566]TDX08286.1 epoxide hydrolase-like protein [Kribbella sp. VKM Ac-2566]